MDWRNLGTRNRTGTDLRKFQGGATASKPQQCAEPSRRGWGPHTRPYDHRWSGSPHTCLPPPLADHSQRDGSWPVLRAAGLPAGQASWSEGVCVLREQFAVDLQCPGLWRQDPRPPQGLPGPLPSRGWGCPQGAGREVPAHSPGPGIFIFWLCWFFIDACQFSLVAVTRATL